MFDELKQRVERLLAQQIAADESGVPMSARRFSIVAHGSNRPSAAAASVRRMSRLPLIGLIFVGVFPSAG